MNQLQTAPHAGVPAPMSQHLATEVAMRTNRLDPERVGFSIAAEDAPDRETRQAMSQRVAVLNAALRPIGAKGAAAEVMALALILKSRGKSAREAEATLDLYVKNLAGLPGFAVVEACLDYQEGRAGDRKWMPEAPDLRQFALDKMRHVSAERQRIQRVLNARVRPPRASPERRAASIAMAREVADGIRRAGRLVEAERLGRTVEEIDVPPETPNDALARAARLRDAPVALSVETRAKFGSIPIDPDGRPLPDERAA